MRLRFFAPLAVIAAVHAAALPALAQPRPAPTTTARPSPSTPPAAPTTAPMDPLKLAQQQYDELKYEESIQTLTGALVRPTNTKQQKIEIYRLLLVDLITLNRLSEADGAARGLLVIEPAYEFPRTESPRFRDFFATAKKKWEDEGRPGVVKEAEPAPAPVVLQHVPPSSVDANAEIRLTARVEDPSRRVTSVKLYYRTGSRASFQEVSAGLDGSSARANVPPSAVKPPFVEYYFTAFDKSGPVVSRGDASAPYRVTVPESGKGWVLPLVIGGVVLGAAAIVGGLALAGVFKSSPPAGRGSSAVSITIGE